MKLLVFLGNYPKEYYLTRHNLGFFIADFIQQNYDFNDWNESKKLFCDITRGSLFQHDLFLIKPRTYMNLSGDSVVKVIQFYKINITDIVVIHDDIDLAFGVIKITNSRNSAGHNGVKSVNSVLHQPYNRIRIGVGRPKEKNFDISSYVLSQFSVEEKEKLEDIAKQTLLTIKTLL